MSKWYMLSAIFLAVILLSAIVSFCFFDDGSALIQNGFDLISSITVLKNLLIARYF